MAKISKKVKIGIVALAMLTVGAIIFLIPENVNVETARKMKVEQSVNVTGNIAADEIETLYAPVSGRIIDISVKAGDIVKENDVIASYDMTIMENEYEKASAALEASKQGYEAAVTENNKATSKYAKAQAAENSNRAEIEGIKGMINALDITNRGDYLQPDDYARALDLEACMKTVEQDTQINLTDKSAAEARLQEAESNKRPYKEAYEESKKIVAALETEIKNTDPTDPEIEILKEELKSAKAQLSETKSKYDSVKKSIEDAENDLTNATNKLNHNKEQLSSALSQLNDINKRNYDKNMSDAEYTQYLALQSRLELLQQDFNTNFADRQFNEGRMLNNHTIEQYQSNVNIAKADADSAQYTHELATRGIMADKGGIILEKYIDANAMVEAGTPICTVQPVENIKAEVKISKYDIDKIDINQPADITLGDRHYTGRVIKIFPVAEVDSSGKPKVKVWVEIDVSDNIPTIGLEAKVVIHTAMENETLAVPFDSVYTDEQGDYVYTLEKNHAVKKYIQIGIKGDDNYSVISGIMDGEEIIVSPFSDDKLKGRYSVMK